MTGTGVVGYSNLNLAVPFNYTDPSLSGVVIKALHFTEPRQAINAGRTAVGWPAKIFSDPSLGGIVVQGAHLTEMRNGVNELRMAVGTGALSFTDPTLNPGTIVIKGTHILEIRGGL